MEDEGPGEVEPAGFRRLFGWALAHPLLVVALVGALVALGQGVWIWQHRLLGGLDADEAGYIASALRFERLSTGDPLALPRAIGGSGTGPLMPLLSVPLLWIGPRDARTALLMSPLLTAITAVGVAGITRRLAGAGAAIVAGIAFLTLPTVVLASQTYVLGNAAACSLALAFWALLASERLTNRWTYAFGAALAAMLLSRTMTLGFLPGAAAAGMIVAGRDRRSWAGLVKAGMTTIVLAGPWYLVARDAVFGYLFSYGFGGRAGDFGEGGPVQRIGKRLDMLGEGLGWTGYLALALTVVAVVVAVVSAGKRRTSWTATTRGLTAVGVAVVCGFAMLASTTNNGMWFELPIVALLVAVLISVAAAAPSLLRAPAVAIGAVAACLQLAVSWWWIAPGPDRVPFVAPEHRSSQYEFGYAEFDPRFAPERRREQAAASSDWWQLSETVADRLHEMSEGSLVVTFSGSFQLFNNNTVLLAAELDGWTPRLRVPNTDADASVLAEELTPRAQASRGGAATKRLVVIVHHEHDTFPPDDRVDVFYRQAVAAGWESIDHVPIPGGGDVEILGHP